MRRQQRGRQGESRAVKYLQNKGYRILARNFSYLGGEIDLVALEGEDLVFVEVKTRRGDLFGRPEEAVTPAKIRQIRKAGYFFHNQYAGLPESLRIDVVSIILTENNTLGEIRIFKNVTR